VIPITGSTQRIAFAALCAVVVAVAVVRFGYFLHEPPGRDQGQFSTLADGVLHGKLMYRDLWENKPPGVVWLYVTAIAIMGRDYVGIHVLQAVFATLTALSIALLVLRATGTLKAAAAAAILYVINAGGIVFGGFWATAQTEVFMDFPIVTALVLLLAARDAHDRRASIMACAAGLCLGWVILLKYSAIPLAALILVAWRRNLGLGRWLRIMAVFACGFALPGLALAISMAASGTWEDFFHATVTFNLEYLHNAENSRGAFLEKVFYAWDILLPFYIPAAFAVFVSLPRGKGKETHDLGRVLTAVAGLLWGLSLIEVFWQGKFWIYHYHVVLLPLALLAGVGVARAESWARSAGMQSPFISAAVVAILALLSLPMLNTFRAYDKAHMISAHWLGKATAERMESTYIWNWPDYEFAQTKAVAAAIAAETPPGSRLFVWGFESYVYFLSGREPASRFLYDHPLMPRYSSVHKYFADQLLDDLHHNPPERVLVMINDRNDIETEDSLTQLKEWPALLEYIKANYVFTWRLGDFLCFARRPGAG